MITKVREEQPKVRRSGATRGLLDLYLEESAAFRLLDPDEQHVLLVEMIGVRDRWLLAFMETESALGEVWKDLQAWERKDQIIHAHEQFGLPAPLRPSKHLLNRRQCC